MLFEGLMIFRLPLADGNFKNYPPNGKLLPWTLPRKHFIRDTPKRIHISFSVINAGRTLKLLWG